MSQIRLSFPPLTLGTAVFLALSGCGDSRPLSPPASPSTVDNVPPSSTAPLEAPSASGTRAADPAPTTDVAHTADELLKIRERLDRELWAAEVEAQRHEEPFIRLWDTLRTLESEYETLRGFTFRELRFEPPQRVRTHPLEIEEYRFDQAPTVLSWVEWTGKLTELQTQGYRLVQSEWHHSRFEPATESTPAASEVSFALDLRRPTPAQRISLRGRLRVVWAQGGSDDALPRVDTLELLEGTALVRAADPVFREVFSAQTEPGHPRIMPLLIYDLDGNGGSEVILGGLNRVYWNDGHGRFTPEPLTVPEVEMFDAAVLGDFNGDGHVDLLCVSNERVPMMLEGDATGRFRSPPRQCADSVLELPKAFTAGDIDQDGDLDVWIGQYKFPYLDGSMPTPFYDSNDGYPAVLLENDGTGTFRDITETAGLATHRRRRTYSSSLVDLDGDRDLDLMTVNDFCGIDVYQNDGRGRFTDASDHWLSDRHLFGMGHTIADYNLDGRLDMYLIGMSSTTARRLDRLNLGPADRPDINAKRKEMGYGNRMLLCQTDGQQPLFQQAPWNDAIARTGWSWGTTSFDFNNDRHVDIYVANGHNSGESARDYCTRYWCHDVYTGSSQENPELLKLFGESLRDLHQGQISWNGFEHNVLWMNLDGGNFINVAYLLGVGFEFDGRGVASDDIDNDGRRDLLAVRYHSNRAGHAEYELLVLRNELDTPHHWIGVRLAESITGRSPVGAQVRVTTSSGQTLVQQIVNGDSFSTQHAPTVHFGLGAETQLKEIQVRWPNGAVWTADSTRVDQYYNAK